MAVYNRIRTAKCNRKQKRETNEGCDEVSEPVKFYAFKGSEPFKKQKLPKIKKEHPVKAILRSWFSFSTLFIGLCGFFLTGAGFFNALYPFGIAWFAAVSLLDKKRSLLWLIAAAVGYLWFVPENFPMYTVVLLAEFCCFLLYPAGGSKPQYYLPVTVFTAVIVIRGLFLVFSGISDTLLVIILTESILAAGFSLVLFRAFEVWQLLGSMEKPGRGDILCILIFAGGLLLGMENIAVYSVSPANIAMCFLILAGAYFGGVGGGAAFGAALGVVPSLSAIVSPAAIGMYAFSGFTAGLFRKFRRPGIIFGYLLGNILLSLYLLNTTLFTSSAVETLIGAGVFLAIPKSILFRLSEMIRGNQKADLKAESRLRGEDYAIQALAETGKNLSSLRDTLAVIHKEAEPKAEKNISSILDHISAKICSGCSLKSVCWDTDFDSTYRDLMRIFALADANDGIGVKELPSDFRRKCCHYKEMTAAVNCLYELYRKNEYWQQQVVGSRSLALSQLDHTVRLLDDLVRNIDSQRAFKDILYTKLSGELRKRGLRVDKVSVRQLNENELVLDLKTRHCVGERRCCKEIASVIQHLTGKSYAAAECRCGSGYNQGCVCRFVSGNAITLDTGSVQLMREGSTVCGDTQAEMALSEGKDVLMISDGMGSGPKAKKESEFTVSLVKEVLESGFGRDFATGLVRYMMLAERENDVYATVDLCVVDRIRKEAEFVKLGAGASYLCTPGKGIKVIRGESSNMEETFLKSPRAVKEEVQKGDVIILASDGVSEAAGEGMTSDDWLIPLIEESCNEAPKVIGERIANKAVMVGGGKVRDDITVTVAKVG